MTDLMHADHLVSRCPFCGAWRWMQRCHICDRRLGFSDRDLQEAS